MDGMDPTAAGGAGQGSGEDLPLLAGYWPPAPEGITYRTETDADVPWLCDLYRTTREAELQQVDWPEELKQAFIQQQFSAQREQYRQHYPGAAFLVIEREGDAVGRLYLHHTRHEVRLMEVTLLPALRGQGLGTRLMAALLAWSRQLKLPMTLHVEPFNPAQRLYQRLGFVTREVRGIYHFMCCDAPPGIASDPTGSG